MHGAPRASGNRLRLQCVSRALPIAQPTAQQSAEVLLAAEARVGAHATASQAVLVELAMHLADPSDLALASVSVPFACVWPLDCEIDVQQKRGLRLMHMADDLMTKSLYDERAPEAVEFARIVTATVLAVVSDPTPSNLERLRTHLDAIADFVRGAEAGFVRMLGRLAANLERAPDARGLFKRVLNGPYGRFEAATYLLQRAEACWASRD